MGTNKASLYSYLPAGSTATSATGLRILKEMLAHLLNSLQMALNPLRRSKLTIKKAQCQIVARLVLWMPGREVINPKRHKETASKYNKNKYRKIQGYRTNFVPEKVFFFQTNGFLILFISILFNTLYPLLYYLSYEYDKICYTKMGKVSTL